MRVFAGEALATAFDAAFGTDSEYGPIDSKDRPKPLDGPWRHGSLKAFAALRGDPTQPKELYPACGLTSDSQADLLARTVPVAALFAGGRRGAAAPEAASAAAGNQEQSTSGSGASYALLDAVAAVTRVTQNTDVAVAFAQAFGALLGEVVARGSAALPALAAAEEALLALDQRRDDGEEEDSEDAKDARESARQALATARKLASEPGAASSTGLSEQFLRTVLSYAAVPSLAEVTPKPIA